MSDNIRIMIYFLQGEIIKKGDQFLVVKTGGIGFKVFLSVSGMRGAGNVGEYEENSEVGIAACTIVNL